MISLPWIALSLVTELVTVALHCPRLPGRLVTELVTEIRPALEFGGCKLEPSYRLEYDPTVAEVSSLGGTHVWLTQRK